MATTSLVSFSVSAPSVTAQISSPLVAGATGTGNQTGLMNFTQQQVVPAALGSAANQFNVAFGATIPLATGTAYTINLLTGDDGFGNVIGMVHCGCVIVVNYSTTAAQIITVGGGTHPVLGSDQYTVQANGGTAFILNPAPGYSVVTSSSDTLTLANASGTASVGLLVLGRNA